MTWGELRIIVTGAAAALSVLLVVALIGECFR